MNAAEERENIIEEEMNDMPDRSLSKTPEIDIPEDEYLEAAEEIVDPLEEVKEEKTKSLADVISEVSSQINKEEKAIEEAFEENETSEEVETEEVEEPTEESARVFTDEDREIITERLQRRMIRKQNRRRKKLAFLIALLAIIIGSAGTWFTVKYIIPINNARPNERNSIFDDYEK